VLKKKLLSIASGHSHVKAAVVGPELEDCQTFDFTLNLHSLDSTEAGKRLRNLLGELSLENAFEEFTTVLTLPGINREEDAEEAREALRKAGWKQPDQVLLADDTLSVLAAESDTFDCVIAISGTGASVLNGKSLEAMPSSIESDWKKDGLGPLLGDYGSGFRVGLDFTSYFLRRVELGMPLPKEVIYSAIRAEPNLMKPKEMQRIFDSMLEAGKSANWNLEFAKMAVVVTKLCRTSLAPTEVSDILIDAANDFVDTIAACKDMSGSRDLPVYCNGGMFRYSPEYRDIVTQKITEDFPGSCLLAKWHTCMGGLFLGLMEPGELPTKAVKSQFLADRSEKFIEQLVLSQL